MRLTRLDMTDRKVDNLGTGVAASFAARSTWSIKVYGNHVEQAFSGASRAKRESDWKSEENKMRES